jgi:hypothetical protein
VAAELKQDATLEVHEHRGRLNELRVAVDGTDVVDTMWYPTPTSVVERVRAHLRDAAPAR